MQITVFNTAYGDSYTFTCKNIEEGREIIKKKKILLMAGKMTTVTVR